MDRQNQAFETRILEFGPAAIAEAARLIGDGLPVAVPTETVYGLAADATDGEAVARIYQAKGRPSFNPLIVHVASLAQAETIGEFDAMARSLAERFWPGPLTLVLPHREKSGIAPLVTAGLPTIALRISAHPAMQALLAACGRPLAAPSANASGRISATSAGHVLASLGDRIGLIVDDGPTSIGLESTIVAIADGRARLLRPGPLGAAALRLDLADVQTGKIEAPGQLRGHYAPSKPVRLEATEARRGEWLIGFGSVNGHRNLTASADLIEAASNVFAALHEAEAGPHPRIAVAPVPHYGLGLAINDRLQRAAAPP